MKAGALLVIIITLVVFVGSIGLLSQRPGFAPIPAGHAELRISLAHRAERTEQCRQLTEAEREALPPTRRVTEVCERGRASTYLEVRRNDQVVVSETIRPSGLHGDGRAYYLAFMPVPAGEHLIALSLSDGDGPEAFRIEQQFPVRLAAGEAALLSIGDGQASLHHNPVRTEEEIP